MRSEAAWNRVCAELGKVYGEMVAAQEQIREHERTIETLRRDLAKQQDALQKEG
jgi:ABC-type Fe2+-enterobactin transport system substrate-binding protein